MATLLRDWLPKVIQRLECFLSSKDINAGAVWFESLREGLEKSKIGILCLTPESIQKPWILFEAGFIARSFDQRRVYPLLIGLQVSSIPAPLAIFQGGGVSKVEMFKLVQMVNESAGVTSLDGDTLKDSFDLRWTQFQTTADSILKQNVPEKLEILPSEPWKDALEETLKLVRGMASGTIPVVQRTTVQNSSPLDAFRPPSHSSEVDREARNAGRDLYEKIKDMVEKRRPLAMSWFSSAEFARYDGTTLEIFFRKNESNAADALLRPNMFQFLSNCVSELGVEKVVILKETM